MRRILLLGCAALALGACKPAASGAPPNQMAQYDTAASSQVLDTSAPGSKPVSVKTSVPPAGQTAGVTPPPTAQVSATPPPQASMPMLAYSYDYGIEAPAAKVRPLMQANEAECVAAGPLSCQVTSANLTETGKDEASAKLTLRATPAWLKGYEDRLGKAADDAGGRIAKSETTSEDLSRQIVDTQAAIRAKTALRDRLQTMLETHTGTLDDLMTLQEKLTDAQADLDATSSELAVMQERVATSDVTIDYGSAGVFAPASAWSPVGQALGSIVTIFAATLAVLIYAVAVILPWALLIAAAIWAYRKWWPKRPKRPPPAPKVEPPAAG